MSCHKHVRSTWSRGVGALIVILSVVLAGGAPSFPGGSQIGDSRVMTQTSPPMVRHAAPSFPGGSAFPW